MFKKGSPWTGEVRRWKCVNKAWFHTSTTNLPALSFPSHAGLKERRFVSHSGAPIAFASDMSVWFDWNTDAMFVSDLKRVRPHARTHKLLFDPPARRATVTRQSRV